MPLKQITSSKVHPGTQMKEGEWRFSSRARVLFHKYFGILHEFWTGESLLVDGSNRMRPGAAVRTDKIRTGGLVANLVTKTGAYTATGFDYTIICNASGGSFTVTLPAAASHKGRIYYIKKIDSSANTVTIDGNGSETVDDATTAVITTQYEAITVQSDGSEWWIL